ncbi:MAG: hypothetical protein GY805_11245 [Chloroflexi bacterium]|nr:hypothetical protein [Chloroflexota bacterium]
MVFWDRERQNGRFALTEDRVADFSATVSVTSVTGVTSVASGVFLSMATRGDVRFVPVVTSRRHHSRHRARTRGVCGKSAWMRVLAWLSPPFYFSCLCVPGGGSWFGLWFFGGGCGGRGA